MSERAWYYLTPQNVQAGPVPQSELHRLIAAGTVGPQTLVWSDNLSEWTPAGRIAALDPRNAVSQPAQPQVQPQAQAAQAAGALAPSELIVLNADQFASKGSMLTANFDMIHKEGGVSSTDLGKVIGGAAVIYLEQAGALRLKMVNKKAFLRTVTVLVAEPTGAPANVPPTSLEGAIQGMIMARGSMEINDLFYTLLERDSTVPWLDLCSKVVTGLHARGLTYTEEHKKLLLKFYKHKATPEAAQLGAQDITWIRQMLGNYNPGQWQLLTGEIGKAIGRRTESSDDGPDFD
ncbi:MAG TPA: DUF4339 domain-containing protein [Symbiobacteriaceae bacterium]|jgi:hypothetical protein|nr:DUF4339 domain-containing protein [Symbiobacteriaceae bacterium]